MFNRLCDFILVCASADSLFTIMRETAKTALNDGGFSGRINGGLKEV